MLGQTAATNIAGAGAMLAGAFGSQATAIEAMPRDRVRVVVCDAPGLCQVSSEAAEPCDG